MKYKITAPFIAIMVRVQEHGQGLDFDVKGLTLQQEIKTLQDFVADDYNWVLTSHQECCDALGEPDEIELGDEFDGFLTIEKGEDMPAYIW